ncbi:MAG: long-chain fatty acid--CoA ligase, partial [Candidatus Eremiobacteraeota bacterium]|nr:long-chain fatty acid--CoA ligase [Candidatus Eremiobacteraeota bacterium]
MDQSAYFHDPASYADATVLEPLTLDDAFGRTPARAELEARVDALAGKLTAAGIGRGDVVGISLPNSVEFVVAHVAVARIGAVMLALHVAFSDREREALLDRTGAAALIDPNGCHPERSAKGAKSRDEKRAGILPPEPFVLAPTSGTESPAPKICMHSHEGLLSNAAQVARDAKIGESDVILPASGFTHLFGLLGVHVALTSGARLVSLEKFDAARCLDACERERVSVLWSVPAQLSDMLAVAERRDLPHLREIRSAGAPLVPALAERIVRAFGVRPLDHWGMSEIGAGILDGRPLAGAAVRIENGELLYRRADMFRGYFADPEQTAKALTSDGFLRTGDLASLD